MTMRDRPGHRWLFVGLGFLLGLGPIATTQAMTGLKPVNSKCSALQASDSSSLESVAGIKQHCDRLLASHPQSPTAPALTIVSRVPVANRDRAFSDGLIANPGSTLVAQLESPPVATPPNPDSEFDIDPQIIEDSPVLQRWQEEIPDIAADIKYDPAFRTRVRMGYAQFPSTDHTGGIYLGIQDVFIGQTPLTVSAEYSGNWRGDRTLFGIDAQYYLLPLGWYGNVAPVLGYRLVESPEFDSEGFNVGLRIILIPSRGGGADLSLTQTWVAPGTDEEIGLTTFSAGYAVTSNLRVATDIQTQNAPHNQESRVSILLEWML